MISKKKWHVKDKWKRHLALVKHQQLLKYIPPTRMLTKNNIKHFIHRYKAVFVKPVYGSYGNNILKITRRKKSYLLNHENKTRRISEKRITGILSREYHGRHYMIQKGVQLQKLQGRVIDYRLLLLKPNKNWTIMGIMGKLAERRKFVTNFNHGGKPIQLARSLEIAGWSHREIAQMQNRMNRLGKYVARKFNQRYKHCRRLGIDIAIDTQKNIWILEVNTNPTFELFRKHENKNLYHKIGRYMKKIKKQQSNH